MAERLPHIFLGQSAQAIVYTVPTKKVDGPPIPERERRQHSEHLLSRLDAAWSADRQIKERRSAVSLPSREGTYLEFVSAPGFDLGTKSLDLRSSGIRLLNVRVALPSEDNSLTRATIYVPAGQETAFIQRIREFAEEETAKGEPKHAKLIKSIDDIRLAFLDSFWTDSSELMPGNTPMWCEVWLSGESEDFEESFRERAQAAGISIREGTLRFPDRTVVMAHANRDQLLELIELSDTIAEIRKAKESSRFFLELSPPEQIEWVEELRRLLHIDSESQVSVCVLDTGANNGHILLEPILADEDLHSVNEDGVDDHHPQGHGTMMCGLAGYGDLQRILEESGVVNVRHRLESVKILPRSGQNAQELWGHLTSRAVSLAEIQAPERNRIVCMAVASEDGRDQGRPTSWSAELDVLASGYADDQQRLLIVSGGNIEECDEWRRYPDSNLCCSVHDPGQSWNALTVGAYTEKIRVTDETYAGYAPIAQHGQLSPFSTTSHEWETNKWPAKPDIVLEGGNVLQGPDGFCSEAEELSLLSISHEPTRRQFYWANATSAATAQAAWMAAQIQAQYPDAWPETVRGLMVHSAEWTEALKQQFLTNGNRTEYSKLLRTCGYGVPDLNRALRCAANTLTLIVEDSLQPFEQVAGNAARFKTKDMHLHELPWPRDVLLELGETPVSMRITLSYFVEPGPGDIGWKDRYRYASHALRFHLINSGESRENFVKRINKAARDVGERPETSSGSERWTIGPNGRDKGSIHSDTWKGISAELADCNIIGITPVVGWWRERPWKRRWNRSTRYSLIVSIHTPAENIDIYTPVAVQVGVPILL